MCWPYFYRQKSHLQFIVLTLAFGLALSLVDVFFELTLDPLSVSIGCAAVGCFTSHVFRTYWSISNSVCKCQSDNPYNTLKCGD